MKKADKKKAVRKLAPKRKRADAGVSMESFLSQGRDGGDCPIAYMLRTCDAEMQGYGGFQWPRSGAVEAPDWNSRDECGGGLHGLLWGEGSASYLSAKADARWMVCAVWSEDAVSIGGDKVKTPRAWVVFVGERDEAVEEIQRLGAKAPCYGTATAGVGGTAAVGYGGTATAGVGGTAAAGYGGTAAAGVGGTATAGDGGTATAGYGGTATAGYGGTAAAGDRGTAAAGVGGTATAGYAGIVCIKRWNGNRYKLVAGHIGEDDLLPNVRYRLDDNGCFVRADEAKL